MTMASVMFYFAFQIMLVSLLIRPAYHQNVASTPGNSKPVGMRRVVCNFDKTAQTLTGVYSFGTADINYQVCTHLIFHDMLALDFDYEASPLNTCTEQGMLTDFTELRYKNPALRLYLTVSQDQQLLELLRGGVAGYPTLNRVVKSITKTLRLCGFHGLNLEWNDGLPETREFLTSAIRELRSEFQADDAITNQKMLELTATFKAPAGSIKESYDVPTLTQLLDQITILSFEDDPVKNVTRVTNRLFRTKPQTMNNSSAVMEKNVNEKDDENSVEAKIEEWLSNGADAEKMNLVISLVGRSYILTDFGRNGIGSAADGPAKSHFSHHSGHLMYSEMCVKYEDTDGGRLMRVSAQDKTPYWYHNTLWINFEDRASISQKVDFLLDKGIGGVALLYQNADDFTGDLCSTGTFPMSKSVFKQSRVEEHIKSIYYMPRVCT